MFFVLAAVTAVRAEFETPTAIVNVTIVSPSGVQVEGGTILIDHGRIIAAGDSVEIPAHARRVDATGLFAYPGLIDAGAWLGIAKEARTEADRARTEDEVLDTKQGPFAMTRAANRRGINPQWRALEAYAPDEDKLKSYRSAGFTTALIIPRDHVLGGTSAVFALSDAPIRRAVLATDVAMHGSFTAGEKGSYPGSLLGVFAHFRQVMMDAQWHVKMRNFSLRHPATSQRAATDIALDALQPLLARKQRIFFEANTEREIRRALSLTGEFNLDVVITGGKEAWKVADLLKEKRVPLVVSLKFDDEPEYGKKKSKKDKPPDKLEEAGAAPDDVKGEEQGGGVGKGERKSKPGKDTESAGKDASEEKDDKKEEKIYESLKERKERRRLWEEQVANVVRLHEDGVAFSLRTRDFDEPSKFWKNLRMVMERGLSESAALTALTTTPAELLGLSEQVGAIQRGHLANLTLMDKPFAEKKSKVKMVFIDGKKFEIKDEKKKRGDGKKGRRGDHPPNGSDDEATEEHDEAKEQDELASSTADTREEADDDDKSPTFAAEIKADRLPKTQTGGDVIIENATIIPVTTPTLENASILILDGKIVAIGQILNVPQGVTRIDGTGKFVIPGMVDAHSHLGLDGVNEFPLAISAEVRIGDLINPTSTSIFRAVAGGVTTHHTMHGSANPIGGQNAIWKLKYGRPVSELVISDAPTTIKFALGENVTRANSSRDRRGKRFPNTRMGVEVVIRSAFEAAVTYQDGWDDYNRRSSAGEDLAPPRRDLRLEALADILSGKLTVHSHCYRSDEILRLLGVAEDYGFRIGTLQHVLEGYRIAPEIARHGCGASTFSNFWAYKIEAYGAIAHNAALMTSHGINVSINSDSANTIRYFGQEAAKCIKWGDLSENEALRLVTINPAIQLQIGHRLGSLEVGKDGDLAIFNGHPLNTFSKCIMTLIEGEVYFEHGDPQAVEPCQTVNLPGEHDRTIPDTLHRAYAITGATIHPISGPAFENGTVVIVEDKIHAVGTDVAIPPGAGVIDARGLHVYPGMIDAGSTLALTEIGALVQTRDATDIATFGPHLRARSAVHPHSEHIRIARTGGTTTALTKPSGGRISGQSAIIHLNGWTADDMLLVEECALHMTVPSLSERPRRFRGFRPPDPKRKEKAKKAHEKAVDALEKFMQRAKHYAEVRALAASDSQIKFDLDVRLEAMIPYIRGEKSIVCNASSYKQILDTIEFAEKHKLKIVLSGATQSWKLADVLAEKNIPVILGTPISLPRGEYEPWDSIYRCAARLNEAGVKFCFASENASSAYDLGFYVGMAVAHGLPREKAEYAVTLGAAEILGIADRVGSIEVGKLADLIVTTDTPLQTVTQVTHMFIAGTPVVLTSMHTESYEKFKNRPTPNLPPLPQLVGPPNLTHR